MLAEVVSDVALLLEGGVATFIQTLVISSSLVRSVIFDSNYFYFSGWYSLKFVFQISSDENVGVTLICFLGDRAVR